MVVCPNCQHDSVDPLFCDRCNAMLPASSALVLPTHLTRGNGGTIDCSAWHGVWPSDCWRPLTVTCEDRPCRLYAFNGAWWREMSSRVRDRASRTMDVLAPLEILPVEDGAIVVAAGLPDGGRPLAVHQEADELTALAGALAACRLLAVALTPLHQAGLVWLNFDPEALEANGTSLCLANLDLQLFHAGTCPDSLRLSSAYSPPEVCGFRADRIGPATDVFHTSIYLYYRLAGLLPAGFPGQGLEAFDFDIPPLRIYRPGLPPGIAPVLERGLARDPSQRFPSLADLLEALESAVGRVRSRYAATGPVSWESASASVVGRSHELQGLPNQDSHALLPLTSGGLLAIVADGVTHARVGSGEVASQAAVEIMASMLPPALSAVSTLQALEKSLSDACLEASRVILEMALDVAPPGTCDPVDMMSSTVVAAVLAGNRLTLASAGDSRAYLIADGRAEQLTVDGDVRCTHLAAGAPPEEVRDMGAEASALYTCLGVGEPTPEGSLEVCIARGMPHLGHWRLLAGDIVVLCSDGLVEEGVFLDPAELPLLIAEPAGQSAAEMATRLLAAARSRHRDASPWEPTGCGDDITCIVLIIRAEIG